MASYIEKVIPLQVEAEQFDANKGHVAVAPLSAHERGAFLDGRVGHVHAHSEQLPVYDGDYIVTYEDGQTRPMRADLFKATFEPASGGKKLPKGKDKELAADNG
jgi:hypothetical protein